MDWSALRSSPNPSRIADTFALFTQLRANDLRKSPTHPFHSLYSDPPEDTQWPPGEHLHVFLLATHHEYKGQRLASYLCQAAYYYAQQLGFESLHTEASHPATAHIFQSKPIPGVVTHRVSPKDVLCKREDGTEWKRWEGLEGYDVVAVHATIDQSLTFTLLPHPLTLTRLEGGAGVPGWVSPVFASVVVRREETSVLTLTAATPEGLGGIGGYRLLTVKGPLDLGLVGVMLRVVRPLARGRVTVLAVSSFDTDAVAIREEDVDTAIRLLEMAGHSVKFEPVKEGEAELAKGVGRGEEDEGKRGGGEGRVDERKDGGGKTVATTTGVDISGD